MSNYSNTIFNQLLSFLPRDRFNYFVGQHKGDMNIKRMTAWNHFTVMLYAQIASKKSLRDIETGMKLHEGCWHHLGIKTVAKSSIADANRRRSYQIFEKLFYALLERCKEITPHREFDFENKLYSLDASVINLCLSTFDWAKYRTTKGALKLHVLLDNRTALPELINITDGKTADIKKLQDLDVKTLEKGSIIVFDRAYIDYEKWKELDENGLTFVSRTKKSQNIFVVGQNIEKDKLEKDILADEIVMFGSYDVIEKEKYPKNLRRVKYYDKEKQKEYVYLTNNFKLNAKQIADIYKDRWQIELFFKWIKQNLKIKTFLGTSKNAVMTQIWIAMIYYLLVAYIKFQTKFKNSLLELTRMVRETIMFRRNLIDLLSLTTETVFKLKLEKSPQMSFW
ncbi:MAG: IS4 family transposase [Minisyncoccia bacterium]